MIGFDDQVSPEADKTSQESVRCPECEGGGWYPSGGGDEPEQMQCRACHGSGKFSPEKLGESAGEPSELVSNPDELSADLIDWAAKGLARGVWTSPFGGRLTPAEIARIVLIEVEPLLVEHGRRQRWPREAIDAAEARGAEAERAKWEARIEAARVHAAQIQRDLKTRIRASNVTIAALAKTEAALEARVLELREVIEGLLQIATAYLETDEPPSMAAVSTGRDALTLWRRIEDPLNTPDSQLTEEADCA